MVFGLDENQVYNFETADSEIRKLLKNSANSVLLQNAKKHQELLKLYVEGNKNFKNLILEVVKSRMVSQQFEVFAREFKPRTISTCETIIKHFKNVFEAHGRVYNFNFNKDYEAETQFNEIRKTLFKISDEKYFENYAHRLLFTEPNAVIVAGMHNDTYISKKYSLDKIHDVDADQAGIKYLILSLEEKTEDSKIVHYWVYDDIYRYHYVKSNQSFILSKQIQHLAKKCPATFISNVDKCSDNYIEKASLISKVVEDGKLQDLLINSITMSYYKAASAFDTKVRPEVKAKQDFRQDSDTSNKMEDDRKRFRLTEVQSNNPEMMGQVITVPHSKMMNSDFTSNVLNAVQNIPANVDVLQYHDSYLPNLERIILSEVLGRGLGDALRNQALNEDQVSANFEEQARALDMYSDNIATSWNYILTRTAEMFAPKSFDSLQLKLGRKYFLKTEQQLLSELELMQKTFSNSAQIMQKQFEIFLLKNRDNHKALERFDLISALQPFAYMSANWVLQNKDMLDSSMVTMYNHFNQVLSIFEYVNGRIEMFGSQIENRSTRLELLNTEFYNILNNQILKDGNNIEENNGNSTAEE